MRTLAAILVVLTLGTTTLAAQYDRRYEVGLFGAFTKYDNAFQLSNKLGGGVRFAYALTPMMGLEVEGLFQSPQDISSVHIEPLIASGSLVVNTLNASRMSVYVLGGYTLLDFGNTNPYRFTDGGLHAGAGAKFYMSPRFALRVEARGIYSPDTKSAFPGGSKSATHLVASAGVAFFQADKGGPGGPPAAGDADRDRVSDNGDACPDTPFGASVDRRGCPSDADADGVLNGIDKCADTPAGVTVDAFGCPPTPQDSDGDGVNDLLDQCPATPSGATVDPNGCPIDSDQDTVWDGLDRCPDTPRGATVDANGCPSDSDGDRVFDGIDRCPDTPAGTAVDAFGCTSAKDSDGDGVGDAQDRCPNTPAGSRVDQVGCLILFEERAAGPATPGAPARPTLILQGVNFQSGRSVLTTASYAVLDQVAASLVANPEIRIEIAGYTDSTGSRRMNLGLSMARAAAVRAYLARKGVSPFRMRATGFGASGYIADNKTPEGRAMNRRVELHKLN